MIVGKVLGPDGEPAAGATVFWIGERNRIASVPLPLDQDARWAIGFEILAWAQTGTDGAFSLSANYEPDRFRIEKGGNVALLAKAPGAGMSARPVKAETAEITLELAPEVVIQGRLLTRRRRACLGRSSHA